MSHERIGKIVNSNGKSYERKQPTVNLSTDFLTDEEIASLSSEVKTYYVRCSNEEK
ncbi:MAG TPA: hypothetical protein VK067_06605 [Pseudogracilibacillus sp.]|nr:hypothetical protein [Pseudogracilibacillus sp.]